MTEADCAAAGGVWSIDPCGVAVCPPALTGACCRDGTCTIETELVCLSLMGFPQGPGTTCGDVNCQTFSGPINGSQETPPNTSPGTGDYCVKLVGNQLQWVIRYQNMTNPPSAAHFHFGPPGGPPGPVRVTIPLVPGGHPVGMFQGAQNLSAGQIAELTAGQWYINIHTATFPGGEIRGQVVYGPPCSPPP